MEKFKKSIIITLVILIMIPWIPAKSEEYYNGNQDISAEEKSEEFFSEYGMNEDIQYNLKLESINKLIEEEKYSGKKVELYSVEDELSVTNSSTTNYMARTLKHINGQIYGKFDKNTILYSDSSMTNEIVAINQGSVDDAPVIKIEGNAAQIQVGGLKAWVNYNVKAGNNDIVIYTLDKVKNPSYYWVEDGILYHFITTDLTSSYEVGAWIKIGYTPSYLKERVKYYSYDEKYFYTDLNTLINDLKNNNTNNSLNNGNPYYDYYKYLPFRSTTKYTAREIDKYINDNTSSSSKLRGIGNYLIDAQNKYGVNAVLMLGIAFNESAKGESTLAKEKNNIFGLNAIDSDPYLSADAYKSIKDCIEDFAKNWISRAYADPQNWTYYGSHLGNKLAGANVKYASDPFWGEKAASFAYRLDTYLGGKDYNFYQLALFNSSNIVNGSDNKHLYNIKANSSSVITRNLNNGTYEIFADRTTSISSGRFTGNYDWGYKGLVSSSNSILINGRNRVNESSPGLSYKTHIQDYGWQDWKNNGEMSGTSGQAKRLEGVSILLDNSIQGASISYQTHVQDYGWQDWKKDGQLSGTSGESKRLEAIKINLENAPGYKVEYRVHVQDYGWQGWKSNGQIAGTVGEGKRLEAIEIRIVKDTSLEYRTHVQDYGWQNFKKNGEVSGTTGESKRLEAIELKLIDAPQGSNIIYQTHVQDYGWQDWKKNGQISGTSGESKRLEAIKINLENAPGYKIEYRVHVEEYGWQDWKSNGEVAGTSGESKRLEAIEVRIVKN